MDKERRVTHEPLEPLIFVMRSHRVIFDSDLARLYDVTTKGLNQAVKRNAGRFPADFAFQLKQTELDALKSRTMASGLDPSGSPADKGNWSQFVTSSQKHRRSGFRPWVFTKRLAEIDQTLLQHDSAPRDLYRKLQPLLAPPPEPPKRRIGF